MQFKLGTFSAAGAAGARHPAVGGGSAPFPGLVLGGFSTASGSSRVIPLARLEPLLTRLNLQLRHPDSLLSLLTDWDNNFQALAILCESAPEELRRASTSVEELHTRAPIDPPRQIFCTVANFRSHVVESIID
jgi:hypothetical protein